MALENSKSTRRPHSQEEYDADRKALEDRIVNDGSMAEKLFDRGLHIAAAENPGASGLSAGKEAAGAAGRTEISGETGAAAGRRTEAGVATGTAAGRRAGISGGAEAAAGRRTETLSAAGVAAERRGGAGDAGRGSESAAGAGLRRERPSRQELSGGRTPSVQRTQPEENAGTARRAFGAPLGEEGAARRGALDVLRVNTPGDSDREVERERFQRKNKKKSKLRKIIVMSVVELLTLAAIFCTGFVLRYMNMTESIEFDVAKVKNTNIDITKQQMMEGYWTIAVFGVDSRDGTVGRGANADVQLIVSIDMGTGDVKLVSVYRDTYLNLGSGNQYAKINAAYAAGGPEQAVAALNKNLDLDIENYATFNWKAVADAVSMIGGVDVDITKKEFYYMNAYIHETCQKSGISAKNPAAEYIKGPGMQHLNGVQTVAYARLRYMDSDFDRTRRQREVISQVLDKAKKTDLATLTSIIDVVLPQLAFNINAGDIIQLAKGIARYNIVGSEGFPSDLKTQMMGKKGDCVIPLTLASNVTKLHGFLFGDVNYNPSSAIWTYSQKISDDSGNYKAQASSKAAAAEESRRQSREEEEDDVWESETETDAQGNVITKKKPGAKETDENGYLIRGYDIDGEPIYETDSSGRKIKSTGSSTEASSSGRTRSYETDEDGNLVDENGDPVETDPSGNPIETESRRTSLSPGEQETEEEDSPARESTKAGTGSRESTKESTREGTRASQTTEEDGGPGSETTSRGRIEEPTAPTASSETQSSAGTVSPNGGNAIETAGSPGDGPA